MLFLCSVGASALQTLATLAPEILEQQLAVASDRFAARSAARRRIEVGVMQWVRWRRRRGARRQRERELVAGGVLLRYLRRLRARRRAAVRQTERRKAGAEAAALALQLAQASVQRLEQV